MVKVIVGIILLFRMKHGVMRVIRGGIMLQLAGGMAVSFYLIARILVNQNLNGDITHMKPTVGQVVTIVFLSQKALNLVLLHKRQ